MAKSRRVATAFLLTLMTSACATGQYTPLVGADRDEVEQLKENVYRVEYRVSSFTSQEQLDAYLRRRCAELTCAWATISSTSPSVPMCWHSHDERR